MDGIGKAIKLVLDNRNMTQKELADKIGKSETSISLIIQCVTHPRKDTLESISKALGVDVRVMLLLCLQRDDLPINMRDHYGILMKVINHIFIDK